MEIVVDASCIMAVLTEEPERAQVIARTEGVRLVSPGCLPYEIENALSALVKRGRIDAETAVAAYREFKRLPIRLVEPDGETAVRIATAEKQYAYDAYYLVCAQTMGIPLYSLDNGLLHVAKKRGIQCW